MQTPLLDLHNGVKLEDWMAPELLGLWISYHCARALYRGTLAGAKMGRVCILPVTIHVIT